MNRAVLEREKTGIVSVDTIRIFSAKNKRGTIFIGYEYDFGMRCLYLLSQVFIASMEQWRTVIGGRRRKDIQRRPVAFSAWELCFSLAHNLRHVTPFWPRVFFVVAMN